MTRSFLLRSAVAALLLTLGVAFVWGDNSLYDRFIATYSVVGVSIVLAVCIAGWTALCLWVVMALKPTKWARREASRGKTAAVLAVASAACLAGQPTTAHGWVSYPIQSEPAMEIHQPFTLDPEQQKQVDAAVADVGKQAQDTPGFVVTVEMAIGIFIAAILIGTTLVIVVRMICKSLDRMKESMNKRLSRLKEFLADPSQTNTAPTILGAGLWRDRAATIEDLPSGLELHVGTTAPEPTQSATLSAVVANGEAVSLSEFMAPFGVVDKFPADSVAGTAVSRVGSGYVVAPEGYTNLVTLVFESCQGLGNAFKSVLSVRVPVGAVLDVSDLSGATEGRYWRVGVANE